MGPKKKKKASKQHTGECEEITYPAQTSFPCCVMHALPTRRQVVFRCWVMRPATL